MECAKKEENENPKEEQRNTQKQRNPKEQQRNPKEQQRNPKEQQRSPQNETNYDKHKRYYENNKDKVKQFTHGRITVHPSHRSCLALIAQSLSQFAYNISIDIIRNWEMSRITRNE